MSDASAAAESANSAATSAKDAEEELRKAAEDGEFDGEKGDPGFSPKASVTQESDGATISITDESGTTTAKVSNGVDGSPGKDGESAEISGMTATVDGGSGTPSVDVEVGGTPSDRTFSLSFHNLKGDPGERGDDGAAATISVGTVTTGEPGTEASVKNSGTTSAAVLDFVIPHGPKGEKGDKGDPGDKGEPGATPTVVAAEGSDLSVSTDEGTVTIDDSALRARISELEQQTQNVVTGTSTGLVSHGEDAFAQKPREVRIKGKTWVNRWPEFDETTTVNGVTLTCDETGLFTLSGTATSLTVFSKPVNGLAAGKQVALSKSDGTGFGAFLTVGSSTQNTAVSVSTSNTATGTIASDATGFNAHIRVDSGTTVNASFRVMLVDGTEAPDCFTPPASIASVETGKLVTAGKNLLPPVSEWNVGDENYSRYIDNPFPIGTQLVGRYGGNPSGLIGNVRLEFRENYDSDDYSAEITPWSATSTVGRAVTVTARDRYICIFTAEPADAYFDQMQVQLELGSTATSYEPPTVTETPLPEVELRSLPNGTCDELVIRADGTCEVERRTGYIASYTDEEVTGEYVSTGNGLEAGASIVYELDESTTEPQSTVTLPTLPAPTFNQYHDSPVPSDTSTQYVRDINIVIDNLAKQIAGTAATVAINEATR